MRMELYFLIASLPTLRPDEKKSFTSNAFLSLCRRHLSLRDFEQLSSCLLFELESEGKPDVVSLWYEYEKKLRNQLVIFRASKLKWNPNLYLQGEGFSKYASEKVWEITEIQSPLEADKQLYLLRWKALERMMVGHYFSIKWLCLYYLQLQLWERYHLKTKKSGKVKLAKILDQ